ncbi:Yip1 family protein [Paenibacillus alginolyticus]|uniref:YIP1 family protein n=1 Tax=Paenibacillus alginolyticus TaxID=59839 RepID=A0ABT4GCF0_9BACL|nr:Yip1 family protein [Paenibacillus alginolyticus]MCY9693854.1 YIP1 family protein [Paenibacillus alginolyticus]MEC0148189.1 Yip1 family protein [Paenibacillus alginolyticus]
MSGNITVLVRVRRPLEIGLAVLFHPADGFRELRGYRSFTAACILLLLTFAVRVASILMTSFHVTSLQPEDANMVLEIVRIILPLLSWAVSCYLITSIMDGETFFGNVLLAVAYSMIPYIVFTLPIAAVTLLLTRDELYLYIVLKWIVWLWVGGLLIINLGVMNDYSLKKTIGVTLLSLFTLIICWATIGLIFALTNHVVIFVKDVYNEVLYLQFK